MTAPGDPPPPARPRGPVRWCFEDRGTGQLVFAQWPNLPLWIFLVAFAVQMILRPTGRLLTAVVVVAAISLTWWALDELIRGCNPWRRALGAGALAYQVYQFGPLLFG